MPRTRWLDDRLQRWWFGTCHDARSWQITALAILLVWNIYDLSLGAAILPSLVAVVASLSTQAVATLIAGRRAIDLRSSMITGLSLSLLLRGDSLWVPGLAAVIAIASKFLIQIDGKHVFNPAAFGIVALLLTGHAWVSPGQWGQSTVLVSGFVFLGILVLSRAARLDIAIAFLGAHAALLTARALWLGDPIAIPLHQVQNGGLLLFAFFMITDPKTTPNARAARILLALSCVALAGWLLFAEQMRPALYVALLVTSPLVPVLDRLFQADRFVWRKPVEVPS